MIAMIALLLATAFPSTTQTGWMRPESFHLAIGMKRLDVMNQLNADGWKPKPGKDHSQLVVDYTDEKAMTLTFERDRLAAIRFELFALIPEIHNAFAEEKAFLHKNLGPPKKSLKSSSILLYDHTLPNVMVVLSADPNSQNGRSGVGMLVVKYYDPVGRKE